ncbi:N amino acid transport system protein [Purpureocillium lavendulum]|uniref:N amino acid transport system protein n=1 Tax=Purpureocillium lavendulum TaxID=1247861 RepID=A0AB34G024_9HYPO|nr:N amino acid transport system protein [Purpureocillium lavendulum]
MGLLSFLTGRRSGGGGGSSSDRPREPTSIIHQPYHTTVAAHPPVRGTRAVTGNGPISLQQLQRQAARKRSQPQLSTATVKPFFLGVRDERPSSAPGDDADGWRPKSSGRNPRDTLHGHQFATLESYHSNSSRGRSLVRRDRDTGSATPSVPASTKATAAACNNSINTGAGRRATRHVDILDAQGEIKPSDFKSRVRAAGARDYGEDVADRNLGENGVDLTTPAVQRFYATLEETAATKTRYERRATMVALPTLRRAEATMLTIARPDDQDVPRRSAKRCSVHGLESAVEAEERQGRRTAAAVQRTRSLDSRALLALPKPTSSTRSPSPERGLRHVLGSVDGNSASRSSKSREKGRYKSPSPTPGSTPRGWITTVRPQTQKSTDERRRGKQLLKPQAFESGQSSRAASPPAVPRYRPLSAMGITSDNGKAPATHSNTSTPRRRQRREGSASRGGYLDERAYTPVAAAHREMRIYDSQLLYSGLLYDPRNRDSGEQAPLPLMREYSSDEGSLSDSAPAPSVSTRRRATSRSRSRSKRGSHAQWRSPWISREALAAPEAAGPSEPASTTVIHSRNRSWSCLSAPGRASISDFLGYVPARNSSLRQWSISSITPTTELSDGCSTLFPRPQSNHTANTSLDMPLSAKQQQQQQQPTGAEPRGFGAIGASTQMNAGGSLYVPSLEDDAFTETTVGSRTESRTGFFDVNPPAGKADSVDFDAQECDCADGRSVTESDSDVDSFVEKRRAQVKDDESLLFKEEGFGKAGTDLPGLFDPSSSNSKPCLMCSLLHCAAIDPPFNMDGTVALPPCGHREGITRRDRLRALGYEYDTDDSAESEPEMPEHEETEPPRQGRDRGRSVTQKTTIATASAPRDGSLNSKATSRQAQEANKRSTGRRLARSRGVIEPVLEGYEDQDVDVEF